MNILFVSHRIPYPPSDGARIRAFQMIRHLTSRGKVTVATLARSSTEATAGQGLAQYCERLLVEQIPPIQAQMRMIGCLAGRTPSSMGYFRSPSLQQRINTELAARTYGLIVVHSSSMAPYVANVEKIAKLLDFCDMDSQKWLAYARNKPLPLSLGYRLEGTKLRAAEAALAGRFDVCTCITSAELAALRSFGTARASGWFSNGVDLDYFVPAPVGNRSYDADAICFVGRMDYYPNVQAMVRFCGDIFPMIRQRRPEARLVIVGADPVRAVRQLARQPGVEITGTVPDVRPYLRQAAVSIAPLQIARGMQNKILEAMSSGVPVVASTLAARAIDAEPGKHLVAAETPQEFAEAVLRLMACPEERMTMANAARQCAEERYTWAQAMLRFDRLVKFCLARDAAGSPSELKHPARTQLFHRRRIN